MSKVIPIIIFVLMAEPTLAATITVSPGGYIQAAIDVANPGDTIEVVKGTYHENVNVVKPLILRGLGKPVLDAGNNGSAIIILADRVVIKGFTLANSSSTKAGITINNVSKDNILEGNTVTKNRGNGIDLWASKNNSITGNIIIKNKGNGIALWSCDNNKITDNTISQNNGSGIFGGSSSGDIIGNTANNNNGSGIVLLNSFNNSIIENLASNNNGPGIMFIFGSNNTVSGNTAANNKLSGISLLYAWKGTVMDNIASKNHDGIYLGNSSDNTVVKNKVDDNRLGINLDGSSNNIISLNSLINNAYPAFDNGSNKWDNGLQGNRYSDFKCSDSNGDEICDSGHLIPGGYSVDRYPLIF